MMTPTITMEQITHLIPQGKNQALYADILAYTVKYGPCTRKVLLTMFGAVPATPASIKHMDNVIRHLSEKGLLVNAAKAGLNLWVVGDGSSVAAGHRQCKKTVAKRVVLEDAEQTLLHTPPRQIDVMNGPVYRPSHSACLRAGAMDFQSIPSRGFRC